MLKRNLIANYIGQGWTALMALAFIPVYIKYLGIEAYGLIGLYAVLQAWLSLLDMGMTPTLNREMARFTGGAHTAQSIRDLLRSIEMLAFGVAIFIAIGVWVASDWLAEDWLRAEKLSIESVTKAFTVMGIVTALRFIEGIYRGSIAGLQRQVLLNIVSSVMETIRGVGALGVLIWISPSIEAFFVWQGIISIITLFVFTSVLYLSVPKAPRYARFSISALKSIWKFASGMLLITFLALLLTQVDKVLLSRLLTLEAFGYYSLAFVVSNAIYRFAGPVTQAIFPHFSALQASDDQEGLASAYHKGSQLVTVLMGSAAVVLIVFSDIILNLWTGDAVLSEKVAPLVSVLSLGVLLNGLMQVPALLQLAHNWTSLTVKSNSIAICIIVPAIYWSVQKYGAIGAAWVWVALNVGYIVFNIYFIHRRILRAEKWRWYFQDVAIPLGSSFIAATTLRILWPEELRFEGQIILLLVISGLVLGISILTAPAIRLQVKRHIPLRIKSIFSFPGRL